MTYTIQEGERFTVNKSWSPDDHTRDYVVQRECRYNAGDALSQQDLLDTQTNLYDLGIFSQVDTAVQNPDGTDPEKNVLVQFRKPSVTHSLTASDWNLKPDNPRAPPLRRAQRV